MRFDSVEHFDHFDDEILYWINLSDIPEPLQQAARKIDGKEYSETCFGMCVAYDLSDNRFTVVSEIDRLTGAECSVFYIDNDGDKHWLQADLPDILLNEVINACKEIQNGTMLEQGYAVLNTALFDDDCGFVIGKKPDSHSPFVVYRLIANNGMREYYDAKYHREREEAEKDMDSRIADYKRFHRLLGSDTAALYPYSQAEARRLGESALWDASFHANVSCAREIENAIRVYGDGNGVLKPEASRLILERWGFKRTNFVLSNTIERLGPYKEQLSAENQEWQKKAYVPPNDAHNRYFEVDTATAFLDAFIGQVREAYGRLELFGPEHCEPDSYESLDYEGRVLVLSPDTLKESCWTPQNQLWLAHDGFGCSPRAIGRSIRCTCLGDGEMTRWNRTDFTGVLKEEFLPGWAREKLEELQGQNAGMGGMDMT